MRVNGRIVQINVFLFELDCNKCVPVKSSPKMARRYETEIYPAYEPSESVSLEGTNSAIKDRACSQSNTKPKRALHVRSFHATAEKKKKKKR